MATERLPHPQWVGQPGMATERLPHPQWGVGMATERIYGAGEDSAGKIRRERKMVGVRGAGAGAWAARGGEKR